jgi:hypothetical protein
MKPRPEATRASPALLALSASALGGTEDEIEMIEGPEAWERFRAVMKSIIKVPRTALPTEPMREAQAGKKANSPKR